jgi:hypothetical protein
VTLQESERRRRQRQASDPKRDREIAHGRAPHKVPQNLRRSANQAGALALDLDTERERRRERNALAQAERDRAVDDLRCMTIPQWAEVCGFSIWTAKRLLDAGKGPKVTQLSDRRVGIVVRDHREWLASRAKERS